MNNARMPTFSQRLDYYQESTQRYVKTSRENAFRLLADHSPQELTAYFSGIEAIEKAMGKKLKYTDKV